jgi:glutamate carboxypeptidase
MCSLLEKWSNINTGSSNLSGLALFFDALVEAFLPLGGEIETVTLPPYSTIDDRGHSISNHVGKGLSIRKRPDAPVKVFLGGHMDTVFDVKSPFQRVERIDANTFRGPGVTDLKGGLVVMLKALEALERTPFASKIGWEIFFNPDEEIGSPSSADYLRECGRRNHFGLIFEPSLPDGTLVSERMGSGNFTMITRGKSAHVGREFAKGENAILSMATLAQRLHALNSEDTIVNVGKIVGGGPTNIVPDFSLCRVNVRVKSNQALTKAQKAIDALVEEFKVELHGSFGRKNKPFDEKTEALFNTLAACGKELGMDLSWRSTGGVCDGNILAEVGLPTIDTLGVRGGKIHTTEEYAHLESLTERSRLVALLLMKKGAEA